MRRFDLVFWGWSPGGGARTVKHFSIAAGLLVAAFGIAQFAGVHRQGESVATVTCTTDPCEMTQAAPALRRSLSPEEVLARPYLSVLLPSASQEQGAKSHKQLASLNPQLAPSELSTAEPEALIEPEGPPTVAAEAKPWVGRGRPITVAFAYLNSHTVGPITASAIEQTNTAEPWADASDSAAMPLDAQVHSRSISRDGICNAIVSAARGNGLPVPFFANLIWQESNFHLGEISDAGALGVAQFIPETANEHGLINPFEPIHAIYTAGKFLRRLQDQYRNLGATAAAYNAGPGRVNEWLAKRRGLPAETRAYVKIITGHRADQWASAEARHNPEIRLMPAKAPCAEVAEAVAAEAKLVRVAKLMVELAGATRPAAPAVNPAMAAARTAAPSITLAASTSDKPVTALPQPKPAVVSSKPAVAPKSAVAASKPAAPQAHVIHVASKPAPHAARIVAKLDDRAPTAPQPKNQSKPARQASFVERVFGDAAARKPSAAHPATAPAQTTVARKVAHTDKPSGVALSYAER
jgi:soluble lytic murein transglycosylase-like protein